MLRKSVIICIIAFLWTHIPICGISLNGSLSRTIFVISDDSGPSFSLSDPGYCTCAWNFGIHEFTVDVDLEVTDPDGVDTVIGSYNLRGSSLWTNISLLNVSSTSSTYNFVYTETLFVPYDIPSNEIIFDMVFYAK